MRHPHRFASLSRSRVLVLAALCAVVAAAPGLAATTAQAPTVSATVPAVASTADFLASLSISGAVPLSGCTSNAQCPPGKLCCRDCGFFGCTTMACLTPLNGRCPAIP